MGELMVSKTATEPDVDADEAGQYLTFDVGEECLAMSIDAVKEIIETPVITRVPMTPDY
ncbi:chemotaxis protein CheW, partial [Thiorhodococcus mannitoliphagus]|nr:chemotaxis protein CheW [Thiorhodococcus mannitoliphagus]